MVCKLMHEYLLFALSRDAIRCNAAAHVTAEFSGGARLPKVPQPLLIGIAAHLPRAERVSATQHGRADPKALVQTRAPRAAVEWVAWK